VLTEGSIKALEDYGFIKRTWAEINMDAVKHNFNSIKNCISKDSMMCCVVKADAYGHGAVQLSRMYEQLGADWFAVSNIEEALQLRNNGITKPMLILGYTPENMAKVLYDNNISQAVYSLDYAKALSEDAVKNNVKVNIHLKLDTGMSRIGLMCQSVDSDNISLPIAYDICTMPNLIPQGVFTHFAVSDEAEEGKAFTMAQYENFTYTINRLQEKGIHFTVRHCANSGAIIDYPHMHMDMVRAGIILYGLSPSGKLKNRLKLQPAMELKSVVSHVKDIPRGTTVSYGRTFKADKTMKIATVPIGYADGYVRTIAENGGMQIHGKRGKIIGRICMDQTMVDITNIDDVKRGDCVTVFGGKVGNAPSADDIAQWSGTINYEVTCLVGKRVARVYLENGRVVGTTTLL